MRSGESPQQRTQRKRQLRTVESADDRLERLQRRKQRERQRSTVDHESVDDRLTSASEKTQRQRYLSTIESPDGKLERLKRRRHREGQTKICQRIHCLRVFSFVKRIFCSFTVEVERRSFECDKQCTYLSNMTRLLWSVHVHMVSTPYSILTSSVCRLTLYGLSLLVRTRNALQNCRTN